MSRTWHFIQPGDDPVQLARAAADAIRGLCHATRPPGGLDEPAEAYDVLGALAQTLTRTAQAIGQIAGYLDIEATAGRLGHDLGDDPLPSAEAAGKLLADAGLTASALADDLDTAQQQLALLHQRRPAPGNW